MLKIMDKPILVGNEDSVLKNISTEREELRDRLDKIGAFMRSEIFEKLPKGEQRLMYEQNFCMKCYSTLLLYRSIEIQERVEHAKQ